jgi:hypothetical protein
MLLSNKVYDTLKWIAQYLLPATGTLYFALAAIWGLPYGEQIVGTISALTIFLGVILGISSITYIKSGADTDGTLQIDEQNSEKDIYRLQLNSALENLSEKKKITLLVDPNAKLSRE